MDQLADWQDVTERMSIDDVDMLCIAADIVFDERNRPDKGPKK